MRWDDPPQNKTKYLAQQVKTRTSLVPSSPATRIKTANSILPCDRKKKKKKSDGKKRPRFGIFNLHLGAGRFFAQIIYIYFFGGARSYLRSMDGPPMSMFSMHVSKPLPFATVASKGYRFNTTRSIALRKKTEKKGKKRRKKRGKKSKGREGVRSQHSAYDFSFSTRNFGGHRSSSKAVYYAVTGNWTWKSSSSQMSEIYPAARMPSPSLSPAPRSV